jgi:hypothetical protein
MLQLICLLVRRWVQRRENSYPEDDPNIVCVSFTEDERWLGQEIDDLAAFFDPSEQEVLAVPPGTP